MGGIVGYNAGSLRNCFSTGTLNGGYFVNCFRGLAGINASGGDVNKCFSTVDLTTDGWEAVSQTGGLAGENDGNISNSFSTGRVSSGGGYYGGFVGENTGSISNCYSVGLVQSYGGGLVGYNNGGSISSSYFLVTAGPNNGYGTPLTDSQIKQQASFVGWDFKAIWAICEVTNYPRLQWQILPADFVCPDGVNFVDYSFFANRWMSTNCTANNDCDGTDFDSSGTVDLADLKVFCNYWLQGL